MKGLIKVLLFLMVLLNILMLITASAVVDSEGVVVFHYHRHDDDYEGWELWIWTPNQEGRAHQFEAGDQLGAKVQLKVSDLDLNGATEIGFIVRKGDWEAKDVELDRFIDLTKMENGRLEAFLVEGDETIYEHESDIDLSPNLTTATFTSLTEIELTSSINFQDTEEVVVRNQWVEELEIKDVIFQGAKTFKVVLEEEIDLTESYLISKQGYKSAIPITLLGLFDSKIFHDAFYYEGNDLGFTYTQEATSFRLWAPTASQVVLKLYEEGSGANLIEAVQTQRDVQGTWTVTVPGDLNLIYYTYEVTVEGRTKEAVDPYARAVGVNGKRGMVIDLETTNPSNWSRENQPNFSGNPTDALIYELHMRDWSTHESSGITQVGKFLQFTEPGAIDHLTNLGVTHLHLLPVFDFVSVDETNLEEPQFNWGYDPLHYNVPEGSYATDPTRGEVRINEFKEMVHALNEKGIRVVMDVVYNHTGPTADSDFNKIVPGYYYRQDEFGHFSDGSGCGNETASDRGMMRRFIVDSVVYWATEYHIDGFRFDLMALHDIETMNEVRAALDKIDPSIVVYGEGWDAGGSALDPELAASKVNAAKVPGIAMFNDDLRDGVKGSVFVEDEAGFVNGNFSFASRVKFGIVGAVRHSQIDYELVARAGGSSLPWALEAAQSVNYVSAHDNHTLFDKLRLTLPDADLSTLKAMQKQANAIVLTAQGIPFLHAGVEMMRTKDFDENSYQSSDEINQLNWNWLDEHQDVFEYYQGLVALRGAHPAFRMSSQADIEEHLTFIDEVADGVIAFHLSNHANEDPASDIVVIHNATDKNQSVTLPKSGAWDLVVNGETAGVDPLEVIKGKAVTVTPHASFVLVANQIQEKNKNWLPTLIGIGAIVTITGVIAISYKKKIKNAQ